MTFCFLSRTVWLGIRLTHIMPLVTWDKKNIMFSTAVPSFVHIIVLEHPLNRSDPRAGYSKICSNWDDKSILFHYAYEQIHTSFSGACPGPSMLLVSECVDRVPTYHVSNLTQRIINLFLGAKTFERQRVTR